MIYTEPLFLGVTPTGARNYVADKVLSPEKPLAPPRWLLKANDPELFDREYRKQLDSLDSKQVAEDLGPNAILLCWESFNVRCHRRLVAEWLEEKLEIVVPELEHERAESLPFNKQPSRWDAKPATPQMPMEF